MCIRDRCVGNPVIVSILVASVPNAVHVGVLLSRVGRVWAVVPATLDILTREVSVRPPIQVPVGAADLAVAGPAHLTLADVVIQA